MGNSVGFANYQGKYMKTNNLRTFSGKLLPGDFIGLDETGDGDVNHVGFVTHTGTYKTYNGKYYKDFKVAQHTTDYCEWVSAEKIIGKIMTAVNQHIMY